MSERPNKETMRWKDWRGKDVVREVNQVIDIRDYLDTPGYPLLVLAANTHLSIGDIDEWITMRGFERGRSWMYKRRRLFQTFDALNSCSKPNQDGRDEQARAIMRANSTCSLRFLVRILKERGIQRGKDWVRLNRGR